MNLMTVGTLHRKLSKLMEDDDNSRHWSLRIDGNGVDITLEPLPIWEVLSISGKPKNEFLRCGVAEG